MERVILGTVGGNLGDGRERVLQEYGNLTMRGDDGFVVMSFGSIAPTFLMPKKWVH